jgi:hypothetical protein
MRDQYARSWRTSAQPTDAFAVGPTLRRAEPGAPVVFEYVGRTGLTVLGPITGHRYRFAGPGAKVPVDSRDAASLAAVPNLERARTAPATSS